MHYGIILLFCTFIFLGDEFLQNYTENKKLQLKFKTPVKMAESLELAN